jgi:hypothetical protein
VKIGMSGVLFQIFFPLLFKIVISIGIIVANLG